MTAYKIQNLDCSNCANKLEKALNALPSVRQAKIAFASDMLYIDCDDLSEVKECINQIEPQVEILDSINTKYSWINAELVKLFGLIFVFLSSLVFEHLYLDYFDESGANEGEPSILEIFATMASNATNGDFWLIGLYVLWVAIYVLAGKSVLKGAYSSFKKKEFFDENVLMLSASVAAFCIGASEEAVSIMLFFSAGEYLQNLSVKKSKESINALSSFDLPKAHRLESSANPNAKSSLKSKLDSSLQSIRESTNTCDIEAKDLRKGDEILLYVGEMLPADCVLLSKEASFDISAISGESLPSSAKNGDEILSGSIALHKVAHLKVLRPFAQSQIAKITELIASASSQKSPTENFITTFARYYTPIVFFIALLVAFVPPFLYGIGILGGGSFGVEFREWAYRALVVLMVSCPCALVVSVPIGYFGGIAASSRLGVLIKGSNYLEALSRLILLGFDKTGTITKGVFKVTDIVPQDGVSQMELLGYALCAQDLSSHPIAQSIKKEYHRLAKESKHSHHISEYEEISGLGVRARCDNIEIIAGNDKILHKFEIPHNTCDIKGSVVHIAVQKRYLGYLIISDELKDEAKEVVENLKNLGIKPVLLSGDSFTPCKAVGEMLGIEYFASLLPQDKATTFAKLKSMALEKTQNKQNQTNHARHQAQKVGFVGDGINDAPTLALADVGISMGSGSDISQQNANVIILNNSLTSLLKSIKIAKKTKTIIYENIAFALGVKGVFVILGLFGWASIWEAVFCDVGVALLALANAMRTMRL
ncbi:heavy metal translocating P-type ATPase [Helicobacter sp. T3_23-1059]